LEISQECARRLHRRFCVNGVDFSEFSKTFSKLNITLQYKRWQVTGLHNMGTWGLPHL